jgi:hypothetical protein
MAAGIALECDRQPLADYPVDEMTSAHAAAPDPAAYQVVALVEERGAQVGLQQVLDRVRGRGCDHERDGAGIQRGRAKAEAGNHPRSGRAGQRDVGGQAGQ